MSIFRFEVKRNLRMSLIWAAVIAGLTVGLLSLYRSSFASMSLEGMDEYMKAFPETFKKAFGMDRLNMATPLGYFGTQGHFVAILCGAIFAVLLSSSLLAKEEEEKTAEFLLAKPITRTGVVTQKAMALITCVTLYMTLVWGTSYLALKAFSRVAFNERAFWLLGGMTYLALLAVAGIGLLGSVFVVRSRTAISISLGLVITFFALQIMADMSDKARALAYFTPFKWASAADVLPTGAVDSTYVAIALGMIILSLAGTYVAYNRKDLRI